MTHHARRIARVALMVLVATSGTARAQVRDPARPADAPATTEAAPKPAAQPAEAAPKPPEPEKKKEPIVELHGYVQPQFGVRNRPQALPRDRWEYGGLSSRAGIIISGTPVSTFSYVVHLSIDVRGLLVITGVELIDKNGDGSIENLTLTRRPAIGTLFEEVTMSWKPLDFFTLKLGAMRMPFTVALRSVNTNLMFANRPGANEIFQSGSDQGVLAAGDWLDGRIQASLGAFTGTSLGLLPADTDARGLLYSARVDGNPLGKLPRAETDFERGPFRFGLGAGMLYRSGTLYSKAGYELAEVRDTRISASVRLAWWGLFVQAEALRRLASDNVSSRPDQASGGYAQASFFFPISTELGIGMAPIARVGLMTENELTLPRRTLFLEGGLAVFPNINAPRPEGLRFLVQYIGERRTPEEEQAHAVIAQGQIVF
jgi:hypothetical protein